MYDDDVENTEIQTLYQTQEAEHSKEETPGRDVYSGSSENNEWYTGSMNTPGLFTEWQNACNFNSDWSASNSQCVEDLSERGINTALVNNDSDSESDEELEEENKKETIPVTPTEVNDNETNYSILDEGLYNNLGNDHILMNIDFNYETFIGKQLKFLYISDIFKYVTMGCSFSSEYLDVITTIVENVLRDNGVDVSTLYRIDKEYIMFNGSKYVRRELCIPLCYYAYVAKGCIDWSINNPEKVCYN